MEDMLTNWEDARDTIQMVKTITLETYAHLTTMESSFAWKGSTGISGQGGMLGDSREWGGNGSSSAMGGMVLPSGGDTGSANGCTMVPLVLLCFPYP